MILDRHTLQVHKPLFYFQPTHLSEEPFYIVCKVQIIKYFNVINDDRRNEALSS